MLVTRSLHRMDDAIPFVFWFRTIGVMDDDDDEDACVVQATFVE